MTRDPKGSRGIPRGHYNAVSVLHAYTYARARAYKIVYLDAPVPGCRGHRRRVSVRHVEGLRNAVSNQKFYTRKWRYNIIIKTIYMADASGELKPEIRTKLS